MSYITRDRSISSVRIRIITSTSCTRVKDPVDYYSRSLGDVSGHFVSSALNGLISMALGHAAPTSPLHHVCPRRSKVQGGTRATWKMKNNVIIQTTRTVKGFWRFVCKMNVWTQLKKSPREAKFLTVSSHRVAHEDDSPLEHFATPYIHMYKRSNRTSAKKARIIIAATSGACIR